MHSEVHPALTRHRDTARIFTALRRSVSWYHGWAEHRMLEGKLSLQQREDTHLHRCSSRARSGLFSTYSEEWDRYLQEPRLQVGMGAAWMEDDSQGLCQPHGLEGTQGWGTYRSSGLCSACMWHWGESNRKLKGKAFLHQASLIYSLASQGQKFSVNLHVPGKFLIQQTTLQHSKAFISILITETFIQNKKLNYCFVNIPSFDFKWHCSYNRLLQLENICIL